MICYSCRKTIESGVMVNGRGATCDDCNNHMWKVYRQAVESRRRQKASEEVGRGV